MGEEREVINEQMDFISENLACESVFCQGGEYSGVQVLH